MLNANHYSVGNMVMPVDTQLPGEVLIVEPDEALLKNRSGMEHICNIEGIPLTEKWMQFLSFQFNAQKKCWEIYSKDTGTALRIFEKEDGYFFDIYPVAFVHQLQNLIHALLR